MQPASSNPDSRWLHLRRPGLLGTGRGMMGALMLKVKPLSVQDAHLKGDASQEREPIVCVGGRAAVTMVLSTPLTCCT